MGFLLYGVSDLPGVGFTYSITACNATTLKSKMGSRAPKMADRVWKRTHVL